MVYVIDTNVSFSPFYKLFVFHYICIFSFIDNVSFYLFFFIILLIIFVPFCDVNTFFFIFNGS